jgi:hypothetical protein
MTRPSSRTRQSLYEVPSRNVISSPRSKDAMKSKKNTVLIMDSAFRFRIRQPRGAVQIPGSAIQEV